MRTITIVLLACVLAAPAASAQQAGGGTVVAPAPAKRTPAELEADVATGSTDLSVYVRLALLYRTGGRSDDAEQVLRKALALHRDSEAVFTRMVGIFAGPPKPDGVRMLRASQEWMRAFPSSTKAINSAAMAYETMATAASDRPSEALGHIEQGLRLIDSALQAIPDDRIVAGARVSLLQRKAHLVSDPEERRQAVPVIMTMTVSFNLQ